ncbi:MAG: glycoside hydrolase family 20 protein [Bacteroidales bacterium]
MKRYLYLASLVTLCSTVFAHKTILPQPQKMEFQKGNFEFTPQTKFHTQTQEQSEALQLFLDRFEQASGYRLHKSEKPSKKNGIQLKHTAELPHEAYTLHVSTESILIEASSSAGFFYATQSLMQLLPVEIFGSKTLANLKWTVPAVSITDAPRYPYRGFMLDVARYFLPKDEILALLDYLAIHKINKFHWHLVDDNGWRIEIKKYPLLTTIGGYRVKRDALFQNRKNPTAGEPTPVGGFYTQDEIKEVVRYAQQRGIEVIPEIEMPAHSNAALAAYPHLTCPLVTDFIGTLPGIGGQKAGIIFCAGKDEAFQFLENVIDEVVQLFPSNYIHIGGDEAYKDNWKKCPHCQKRMKEMNIPNEEELQSYFIRRMNNYLASKGKQLMGWDELADSEIPNGATIFGWRGLGQAAAEAAKKGHDIVLTPARALYLIRYQGPQWFEPFTYFGNNTLKDVYDYSPAMSSITPQLLPKVKGLQASMWTEFINSKEDLHYMVFPRLAALADIAWSKQEKDWTKFLQRMDNMRAAYKHLGIGYAQSMFNLSHQVRAIKDTLKVELTCIRPDVQIRYTLDSTMPTPQSPLYQEKLSLPLHSMVLAQTFIGDKAQGKLLRLNPYPSLSTGASIEGDVEGLQCLVNGLHGSECYTDGEYVDLYDKDLKLTLNLHSSKQISSITLGTLLHAGMGVTYPSSIEVEYSLDGVNYSNLASKIFDEEKRFPNTFSKEQIIFNIFAPVQAQFIRFSVNKAGVIPEGAYREKQSARCVFDEIVIL